MIKVSVIYPRTEGGHFDADYYCQKHMTMVKACLGEACAGLSVLVAVDDKQPYYAIGELIFASATEMQTAFAPHAKAFAADLVNYTNVTPVTQMSVIHPC